MAIQENQHDKYGLSPRELECLALQADYYTTQDIAHHLNIKVETVHDYLESARRKLNVTTTTHAVVKAIRSKIINK